MARSRRTTQEKEVQDYRHDTATRKNNPPAGIAAQGKIKETPKQAYAYNPHLPPQLRSDPNGDADQIPELLQIAQQRALTAEEAQTLANALRHHEPWLEWAGKQETKSFSVDPVALHIHERVSTKAILKVAERQNVQRELFADPQQDYSKAVDFYQHNVDWANRLILGDSLTVMSSLAHRENLAGKVQMIYIDPPYGIKFASNFQPTVFQRDVKDRAQDLTREPEQIRAYRDTWTLGIHSYLAYLRDRLIVAKDLLTDSGSVFVQIGDENVHRVRSIMDEVFGSENFVRLIHFRKTGALMSHGLDEVGDYIVWYAKDNKELKYRQLYIPKTMSKSGLTNYPNVLLSDGATRNLKSKERENLEELPDQAKLFGLHALNSQSGGVNSRFPIDFKGKTFTLNKGGWKTNKAGIQRLIKANRIGATEKRIGYIRHMNDFSTIPITNLWEDTRGEMDPQYTVQTSTKPIERCLLMTTDPGDLVLDPTCVRKGTKVLTYRVSTPPNPPAGGGEVDAFSQTQGSVFSSARAEVREDKPNRFPLLAGGLGGVKRPTSPFPPTKALGRIKHLNNSPLLAGGLGGGKASHQSLPTDEGVRKDKTPQQFPPACGGVRGGNEGRKGDNVTLTPIENLRPGDWVLSDTGKPRRVLRTICKRYRGKLIGIRHKQSPIKLWVTADHYVLCKQRTLAYETDRAWGKIPKEHFGRARELRKEMTPAEKRLWKHLRNHQLGVKFRKQHPIGPYITDFYSRDVGLIIEVDGDTHFTAEAKASDDIRTDYLRQLGLTVLRFTNLEIFEQLDGVMVRIHQALQAVRPSKTPLQHWRRSDTLQVGDVVYFGINCEPVEIESIAYIDTDEEVYDLEVEIDHSYLTEVCAVHNCGSGTTAYVAEQWGRRWITMDTSRVAVALARQRLLTSSFEYYKFKDDSKGVVGGFENKIVPHITLKSIAQNTALDPIFAKYEPILKEKLDTLNLALAEVTQDTRTKLLAKLTEKQAREGKKAVTDADRRRWQLPKEVWQEWEVPFDTDPDWPKALQEALTDYRKTWRAKMDEVNACIDAASEGEELVDQPEIDKKRIRVSGPFTVEAVQPAEESLHTETFTENYPPPLMIS